MARAALAYSAVEELQRIARPEPEGSAGIRDRLGAAPISRQSPGENVIGVDARRSIVRFARSDESVPDPASVVEIEERRLELRPNTVRGLEAPDDRDECVSAAGGSRPPRRAQRVATPGGVLRQRQLFDDVLEQRYGTPEISLSRLGVGKSRLGVDVAGKRREGSSVCTPGAD